MPRTIFEVGVRNSFSALAGYIEDPQAKPEW
jgi:hypothetical protein